jgi:hypothetical protein
LLEIRKPLVEVIEFLLFVEEIIPQGWGCSRKHPPRRARKRDSGKGRWGIELTGSEIEKLWLKDLYPPWRERNGTPIKDDGGSMVVTTRTVTSMIAGTS